MLRVTYMYTPNKKHSPLHPYVYYRGGGKTLPPKHVHHPQQQEHFKKVCFSQVGTLCAYLFFFLEGCQKPENEKQRVLKEKYDNQTWKRYVHHED